jgi:hypothetical protein
MAMADSIEQQGLFSQQGRDHTSFKAVPGDELGEPDEDCGHTAHLDLQDRMRHPVAFWSELCGDVMHFGQALQQPDSRQFVESVIKEINGHIGNQNFELVKRSKVPVGEPIQQSVWSMRRKRNLTRAKSSSTKPGSIYMETCRNLASTTTIPILQ